jgi:hypothetical protein
MPRIPRDLNSIWEDEMGLPANPALRKKVSSIASFGPKVRAKVAELLET